MNGERLGSHRRPFRTSPTLDQYVPLPTHEQTLQRIRNAFESGEGLAVLEGESGTGKTTVAFRFISNIRDNVVPLIVPSARFTRPADLYQTLLQDLGQNYLGKSEHELRLETIDAFLNHPKSNQRIAIILDEAQHLSSDLLEELRLLDNLERNGSRLAFTLFVGQAGFQHRLLNPELSLLSNRIRCRTVLEPLSESEALMFIRHQLEYADDSIRDRFSSEAIELLSQSGQGNPRSINQIATLALEIADEFEMSTVDAEVLDAALQRLTPISTPNTNSSQPIESAQKVKSSRGEDGEEREGRESATPRTPKKKVRSRRAA